MTTKLGEFCTAKKDFVSSSGTVEFTRLIAASRRFVTTGVERAERLAHENAALRARLADRRLGWVQWTLVGVIALCGVAIMCVLVTWR